MLSTKSKNAQTVQDHPAYREAAGKLADLQATYAQIEAEINEARQSRADLPAESNRIEDAARAYLAGAGTAVANPPVTLEAIDGMAHRRGVVREAIWIQEQRVEAVRAEVGREIAVAARPEYEAIVKRMAEALAALSAAAEEESAFRERLDDQRVSFASVIPPVPLQSMRLSVYGSRANRWFDEVERDYGFRSKIERRRTP